MSDSSPRSGAQRKGDTLVKLSTRGADVWVASASPSGHAHLVPLSLGWDGERVIVATERGAITTQNMMRSGRARLALGATRDVVMIDAAVDGVTDVSEAASTFADAYAQQADWDPRLVGGDLVFVLLRPDRIQAWREADEIPGRTIMRAGRWLV